MKFKTYSRQVLADTITPVNIYLKLRDVFAASVLLESSDYHGNENSLSFICCEPIATFKVAAGQAEISLPDSETRLVNLEGGLVPLFEEFKNSFQVEAEPSRYPHAGLFGYMAYDAVRYFEELTMQQTGPEIPDMIYSLYRYVIVVDHFHNEMTLFEHQPVSAATESTLDRLEQLINNNRVTTFQFNRTQEEKSNYSDEEFLQIINQGKQHCFRGDVFQIVLSRRFVTDFQGDEFNVYRALRSINPSPYLFYFDYGNFKLFGSSPEAQIQIKNGKAHIYPIAGTFRRSGNDQEDAQLAERLSADEKENAEHIMLVDLARNDMSRNADAVHVEVFKEIQYYSHVIHLVSKVTGSIRANSSVTQMAADTFPAGTLSGAPKHMAMKLINQYENVNRSFYGGAIGFLGFDNSYNHAIMIRTFLSQNNQLIYQAGAGVVSKSKAENELQEVNNKLEALRKAVLLAEKI
ncbi:MAG TPA: anthranilate synthase component I family protein [Cyclobacteriaceae bacterium]|nr:anthranilate synthase component I family protein [Cyclobacteriaceae bacterium]HRF34939.1 anthranilate synthase component I family protein [Cyclobacteriaceae bacterium]